MRACGAQSQLMLGSDENLWVVKFQKQSAAPGACMATEYSAGNAPGGELLD